MDKLNELRLRKKKLFSESNDDLVSLNKIINESYRVAEVAKNSKDILDNLEKQFEKCTGLDGIDVTFLFFATALQCVRQYLVSNEKFRFMKASDGDNLVKKVVPRSYQEILLGPVPYDAFQKQEGFEQINFGLCGSNHRYLTLGHDPLLGWIFGTINILTSSLTKNNIRLDSFRVSSQRLGESLNFWEIFNEAVNASIEDYRCLIASVIRHALHLGSDVFTQQGLPLPVINNISPDFSSKLLRTSRKM